MFTDNCKLPTEKWGRMDSNHRKRKLADLQSAPFGHSGTPPYIQKSCQRTVCVLNWTAKLYSFFVMSNSKAKNIFFSIKILKIIEWIHPFILII
jgi:hypothetical protein